MPIDPRIHNRPATRADFTYAVITTSIAISKISEALRKLQNGEELEDLPAQIAVEAKKLEEAWDKLTGWTPDE